VHSNVIANLKDYENHLLTNLSGGEFKLIQVIREMMISPKFIIMDEPVDLHLQQCKIVIHICAVKLLKLCILQMKNFVETVIQKIPVMCDD